MYTNDDMFSCIYNRFEIKKGHRLSKQLFVYLLLAAVTLQAGTAQCDRSIVNKHLLEEYYFCRSPSLTYGILITPSDQYVRDGRIVNDI